MLKKSKHIKDHQKDFLRYTANEMTEAERNAFEKNLQRDPFAEDALEGLSAFSDEEILNDLSDINLRITKRTKSSDRYFPYRIAAGIAVLIAVSSLFFILSNRKINNEKVSDVLSESIEKPAIIKQIPEPQAETVKNSEVPLSKKPVKKIYSPEVPPVETERTGIIKKDIQQSVSSKVMSEPEPSVIDSGIKITENKNESPAKEAEANARLELISHTRPKSSTPVRNSEPKKIRGKIVSSEDNQPIPGVSISVKGTSTLTYTDKEGAFDLPANPDQDTGSMLEINFIGMEEKEILADAGDDLNIVLNPSNLSLDEVVVIGYGSARKSDVAGSTVSVDSEKAEPVNGPRAFKKYVAENQVFPESETSLNSAKVVLEFSINNDSIPYNIKVIESPGEEFSAESIRLLENGPKWIRGVNASIPTRCTIMLTKVKK